MFTFEVDVALFTAPELQSSRLWTWMDMDMVMEWILVNFTKRAGPDSTQLTWLRSAAAALSVEQPGRNRTTALN